MHTTSDNTTSGTAPRTSHKTRRPAAALAAGALLATTLTVALSTQASNDNAHKSRLSPSGAAAMVTDKIRYP